MTTRRKKGRNEVEFLILSGSCSLGIQQTRVCDSRQQFNDAFYNFYITTDAIILRVAMTLQDTGGDVKERLTDTETDGDGDGDRDGDRRWKRRQRQAETDRERERKKGEKNEK